MRKQGTSTLAIAITTFVLFLVLIVQPVCLSDPIDEDSVNGIRTVTWTLETPGDYLLNNCTVESGYANLSTFENSWNQTSTSDFTGMEMNNVNIEAGSIYLSLNENISILKNGGFTYGGGNADNWTVSESGNFTGRTNGRAATGGMDNDGPCWRNWFVDNWDDKWYIHDVWVNQTFEMLTIPLNVNISAFHNFTTTASISPGSNASIEILHNNSGIIYPVNSTGWVNETYDNYCGLHSDNAGIFNETGNYTLSLHTLTSSKDDISSVVQVENFWDNASLLYDAYETTGNFTSEVLDAGSYAMWKNITWKENLPTGTDIELYLRTGNSSVPTDSIWSDWSAPVASGSAIDRPWGQYIQYRVKMSTLSTNVTPVLESVNITYEKFQLAGTIQTLDYSPANITSWGFFSHAEELNGQIVIYQYSTNSGTLWIDMPLDGDLRAVNPGASIRIRALLSTADTVVTPSVLSMELSYVSREPAFTLEPAWNVASAESGDSVRLYVYFNNSVDSVSSTTWLNVYLDGGMEYLANNSDSLTNFQEFIPDENPNIQKYVLTNIPLDNNVIWIDAILKTGLDDGTVLQTTVTLDYQDPIGNRVESILELETLRVDAPIISAELIALDNSADIGDTVQYKVQVNNTGHSPATSVWLNTTLDNRLRIPMQDTQNFTSLINNLAGLSSRIIYFNLTLGDNVVQDSVIPVQLTVQYSDSTGFIRQSLSNLATSTTALRSSISLMILTQNSQVDSYELFVITVQYNNTGHGNADSVYFNMTLPDGMELDSSSENAVSFGSQYVWEFDDVGPGAHSFTITFRALKMSQDIYTSEIIMNMQVTDPIEGELNSISSNTLSVEIERIYTFWEEIYWPWSGIAMALASIFIIYGLWYYFKPEPPTIDDIFVIYHDGRLISHRKSSSGLKAELDGDLVSAMLTVVQEFISESLSKDKTDKVKKMEFGDQELYVERGENIHLSVMYSGSMNKKLEAQILELRQKIENEHPFLPTWDGRMTELEDIDPQLDKLIEEWQHLNDSGSVDYSPDTDA